MAIIRMISPQGSVVTVSDKDQASLEKMGFVVKTRAKVGESGKTKRAAKKVADVHEGDKGTSE